MYRFVMVDDHYRTHWRFRDFFIERTDFVMEKACYSAYEFLVYIKDLELEKKPLPDLLVIDINMPIADGASLAHYMKIFYPNIKILILTVHDHEENLFNATLCLADGFLMKPFFEDLIIDAFQRIMNGEEFYLDPRTTLPYPTIIEESLVYREERIRNVNPFNYSELERKYLIFHVMGLANQRIAYLLDLSVEEVKKLHEHMVIKTGVNKLPKISEDSNLRNFSISHNLARMADFRAFLTK
ncbi:response regulator [Hydrotalea sandarakina]|jgi:DNA-binding NarL/FixJ family response regulator|uniref:Two-component system response regulator NreC n=1 Tax=Hydrotalea sandarakina TaxID=1004304 RepID=A0A2W7RSG7_9BACT|nr:response regulator [Hydrotalea sandarakina]PZX61836.1 two-component system response regulator NreC [Hydrotalea sandarakina]